MRLIDADVLIKAIQQHMVKINSLFEEEKTVVEIIDAQPTAYDVEKVVAELEEMQVKAEKDMQLSDNVAEANTYGGMMLAYGLAIPIVEKGGVE